jgi:predicted ATP-dependent endonuclease of OLD family
MKILSYAYEDVGAPGWKFTKVDFSRTNLLVGDTASGKTRFLNTIVSLGEFVRGTAAKSGHWHVVFEHGGTTYTWELVSEPEGDFAKKRVKIRKDYVWRHGPKKRELLIKRNEVAFDFMGKRMAKLSQAETGIGLLKEEEAIKPIHDAFSIMRRRSFSTDGDRKSSQFDSMRPDSVLPKGRSEKQILRELFDLDFGVSSTMYLMKKYAYQTFRKVLNTYRDFFPFVKSMKLADWSEVQKDVQLPGKTPLLEMQEIGDDTWIPLMHMSSGMQKVLLILMDVALLPEGGVYLIDEYENSLGVSAIDFFPEFVLDIEKEVQFFITSHHPYLINKMPVKTWYVFHRDGVNVSIRYGKELVEKYGRSKQQAFLQLLNDRFYSRREQ